MRSIATAFAFLLTLGVVGVVAFFTVIILAGPHGGLLPAWLETPVLLAGWAAVIVIPAIVAHRVWRRFDPPAADPT